MRWLDVTNVTVHNTSSITNWEAILTIAVSVATLMSLVLIPTVRNLSRRFYTSIERMIDEKVGRRLDSIENELKIVNFTLSEHDRRLTRLEAYEEGKAAAHQESIAIRPPDATPQ